MGTCSSRDASVAQEPSKRRSEAKNDKMPLLASPSGLDMEEEETKYQRDDVQKILEEDNSDPSPSHATNGDEGRERSQADAASDIIEPTPSEEKEPVLIPISSVPSAERSKVVAPNKKILESEPSNVSVIVPPTPPSEEIRHNLPTATAVSPKPKDSSTEMDSTHSTPTRISKKNKIVSPLLVEANMNSSSAEYMDRVAKGEKPIETVHKKTKKKRASSVRTSSSSFLSLSMYEPVEEALSQSYKAKRKSLEMQGRRVSKTRPVLLHPNFLGDDVDDDDMRDSFVSDEAVAGDDEVERGGKLEAENFDSEGGNQPFLAKVLPTPVATMLGVSNENDDDEEDPRSRFEKARAVFADTSDNAMTKDGDLVSDPNHVFNSGFGHGKYYRMDATGKLSEIPSTYRDGPRKRDIVMNAVSGMFGGGEGTKSDPPSYPVPPRRDSSSSSSSSSSDSEHNNDGPESRFEKARAVFADTSDNAMTKDGDLVSDPNHAFNSGFGHGKYYRMDETGKLSEIPSTYRDGPRKRDIVMNAISGVFGGGEGSQSDPPSYPVPPRRDSSSSSSSSDSEHNNDSSMPSESNSVSSKLLPKPVRDMFRNEDDGGNEEPKSAKQLIVDTSEESMEFSNTKEVRANNPQEDEHEAYEKDQAARHVLGSKVRTYTPIPEESHSVVHFAKDDGIINDEIDESNAQEINANNNDQ